MSFERVRDYIRRRACRKVFVLVLDGRAKCVDMQYPRKIRHLINKGAVAVGVYDAAVPESWIFEDLIKAGVST